MEKVIIYTDGACSGNPGPGGWGTILMYKDNTKEISGGKKDTTNNVKIPYKLGNSKFLIERKFTGDKPLGELIKEVIKKIAGKTSQ